MSKLAGIASAITLSAIAATTFAEDAEAHTGAHTVITEDAAHPNGRDHRHPHGSENRRNHPDHDRRSNRDRRDHRWDRDRRWDHRDRRWDRDHRWDRYRYNDRYNNYGSSLCLGNTDFRFCFNFNDHADNRGGRSYYDREGNLILDRFHPDYNRYRHTHRDTYFGDGRDDTYTHSHRYRFYYHDHHYDNVR